MVEHCWIHDNGAEASIYEHNNYTNSHRPWPNHVVAERLAESVTIG